MAKLKLIKDSKESVFDYNEIKEMSQAMGDINRLYDYCGVWLKCPDCRKKGDSTFCGRLFESGSIRGETGPVVVEFANGEMDTFDAWETIP